MRIAPIVASTILALSIPAFAQSLSGNEIRDKLIGGTFSGVARGVSYSEHLNANGTI